MGVFPLNYCVSSPTEWLFLGILEFLESGMPTEKSNTYSCWFHFPELRSFLQNKNKTTYHLPAKSRIYMIPNRAQALNNTVILSFIKIPSVILYHLNWWIWMGCKCHSLSCTAKVLRCSEFNAWIRIYKYRHSNVLEKNKHHRSENSVF